MPRWRARNRHHGRHYGWRQQVGIAKKAVAAAAAVMAEDQEEDKQERQMTIVLLQAGNEMGRDFKTPRNEYDYDALQVTSIAGF